MSFASASAEGHPQYSIDCHIQSPCVAADADVAYNSLVGPVVSSSVAAVADQEYAVVA